MNTQTDLVVLGAGPGGYAAAFYAADLGMNVTLVDLDKNPGGVCLYRGCIPSKAMLHVAKVVNEAEEAKHWGIDFGKATINADKLFSWKQSVVDKLTSGLGQLAKARKVRFVQGRGKFLNSTSMEVELTSGGKETLSFKHAILATGSHPTPLPGGFESNHLWNSTSALNSGTIPESLLVIGGGYIGLELGSVYAALGTQVTVVEMAPKLMTGADKDLVQVLEKRIKAKFKNIYVNTKIKSMKEASQGIEIEFEGEGIKDTKQTFSKVLVSIGRKPNSANLGLENTKVKINERGFVNAQNNLATDDPHIFAIGDVIGGMMLAHKASHEARVAVDAISGKRVAFEPQAIPAVVFTDPEIAWCGLTEDDAKTKGLDVAVVKFPWAASGRAMSIDRTEGLTKLIIDKTSERILGVGMAGPNAGDMIAEGVLAIEMGATAMDLSLTIHPHPTLSESIMEAAELFYGHCTHMYKPKK